ncbi:hypothetical protein D9M71_502240 [compost metagenome]
MARVRLVRVEHAVVVARHVDTFLLLDGGQRIEVEKGVVRDDAAGGAGAADLFIEECRVLHQSRADLEVAHAVHRAMLDAQGMARRQAGATVLEQGAVAAGVGEVERAVAIAHLRMVVGQVAVPVWDHPVAIGGAANDAAGLLEGLAGQQAGHELLGAHHLEYQFHGRVLLGLSCRD